MTGDWDAGTVDTVTGVDETVPASSVALTVTLIDPTPIDGPAVSTPDPLILSPLTGEPSGPTTDHEYVTDEFASVCMYSGLFPPVAVNAGVDVDWPYGWVSTDAPPDTTGMSR